MTASNYAASFDEMSTIIIDLTLNKVEGINYKAAGWGGHLIGCTVIYRRHEGKEGEGVGEGRIKLASVMVSWASTSVGRWIALLQPRTQWASDQKAACPGWGLSEVSLGGPTANAHMMGDPVTPLLCLFYCCKNSGTLFFGTEIVLIWRCLRICVFFVSLIFTLGCSYLGPRCATRVWKHILQNTDRLSLP